jgi:hypothetical protein
MSHPKIRGRGECFDRYERARLSRVECGNEDIALFRNEAGKINVGILMYNQIPFFESWFGVLRGYKLIHLIRDPLCIAESMAQHRANRAYYKEAYRANYHLNQIPPANQPFDRRSILQYARSVREQQQYYSCKVESTNEVLTIRYETLTHNQQTSRLSDVYCVEILNFMNVEIRQLATNFVKTGVYSG